MILAGASVDDVLVIGMVTAFTGLAQCDQVSAVDFINIPISISVGALAGFLIGFLSAENIKKNHIIAIFCKSYDDKVYKMYGVNPFVACSGSGWINVYMYQMWKDECQKYLPLQVIQRLERDSGY